MPPSSLPTGTVSHESAGTRTFPVESASRPERAPPPSDERAPVAVSTTDAPAAVGARPATSTPIDDRSAQARIAELERENESLRAALDERDARLQSVIDHYEQLLSKRSTASRRREGTGAASSQTLLGRVLGRLGLR